VQKDPQGHAGAIHVLVADDSPFHTQLLVSALSRTPDLKIFSSTLDTTSVLATSIAHEIDIAVLSAFADRDTEHGLQILRELRDSGSDTRSVVLLDSRRIESVLEAFRAGAHGVFDHSQSPDALHKCIRRVNDGQIWINNQQIAIILEFLASTPRLKAVDAKGINLLSGRESAVVRCVVEGLTNREIGNRLKLSQHTIKNYLFRIFDKLGISSRTELLLMAVNQSTADALARPNTSVRAKSA